MKSFLLRAYFLVRGSYWFVPGVMAIGAMLLAFVTIWVDARWGTGWSGGLAFLTANRPDGARAVLATIAGSMITVAGVTFSMTILAVSSAGAQFGPRLVGNFMRDRGNQFTLGILIAVFVFCLMVLRTVRSSAEDAAPAFVPHFSILTGLVLALAGVAVLIYFFHHVPESLNISKITASVGRRLEQDLRALFPADIGEPAGGSQAADDSGEGWTPILCEQTGYILNVDPDLLIDWARERDAVVRLVRRPGDFVRPGTVLAEVRPAGCIDKDGCEAFARLVAIGVERTPTQNVLFLVDEFVEILGRALSPGVNDPFTAINCLDWMGAGLSVCVEGRMPDAERLDDDGRLRVIAKPIGYEEVASAMFDQTRAYVASDRNVTLHGLEVMARVAGCCRTAAQRSMLATHAAALVSAAQSSLTDEADRSAVRTRLETLNLG